MRARRRTGAGIAVLRCSDVLLIRRSDNGYWDIPGGGQHRLETPEKAARRELHEETGLTVGPLRPLGIWTHRHTYPDGNVVDWTTHVFSADYRDGQIQAADDVAEAHWWPLDRLPKPISATTRLYFEALRRQQGLAP